MTGLISLLRALRQERGEPELKDGGTVYKGRGGLTDAEQDILYCVVTRLEIGRVKTVAKDTDPNAFIVTHPLSDAEGGHIKKPAHH
ncbi:MAG TPA: YitT family protein [Pyrinomonadaceae bacterium]